MARTKNLTKTQYRINTLLDLIDKHPEAIDLNLTKLCRIADIPLRSYPLLRRTWLDMRHAVHFERVK